MFILREAEYFKHYAILFLDVRSLKGGIIFNFALKICFFFVSLFFVEITDKYVLD